MDARVHRVQAQVTVWIASTGWRVVEIDYGPGYGDPLARALLEKAQEIETQKAAASTRAATMGGISM